MSFRRDELIQDLELVRSAIREVISGNRLAECTVRGRTYKYQVIGMDGLKSLENSIIRKLKKANRKRQRTIKYNSGL